MSKSLVAAFVLVATTVAACAESSGANGNAPGGGGSGGGGGSSGAGGGAGAPADASADASSAGDGAVATGVAINELSAKGGDWVELYNPTSSAIDLGGLSLADTDPDAGAPSTADQLTFPAGTQLPAKSFLLVLGNSLTAGGPDTTCLDAGGPTSCFHVTWKISSSNGETVYLLDAAGHVTTSAAYPANAVPSGQTWGAIPDGTSSFVANTPTPGGANQAAP